MIKENIQKYLGLLLDSKLNFFDHINEKDKKATKGVNVIRKMNLLLPRSSLLTIYKSFVRPHLDYGDVIYDQPNNSRLSDKIETVQYNAALAITGAIRGTSKEKLYQELGLESLKDRGWLRRMSYLHKIISTKLPPYLHQLIPPHKGHIDTLVVFKLCVVGLHFSQIRFYRLPLLNGINWILILKISIPMQSSVKSF